LTVSIEAENDRDTGGDLKSILKIWCLMIRNEDEKKKKKKKKKTEMNRENRRKESAPSV
jgi:hypothetical protein